MSVQGTLRGMRSITVYCASSSSLDPHFTQSARTLGQALAERGISLVYGGGSTGLMGEVARATHEAGGRIEGIITEYLKDREVAFQACDELVVVPTMRDRKKIMSDRADGFMVLPGGLGTYEEFFEVLVGRVLIEHNKPIGIVNDHGYFDPLIALIEHGINESFIRPAVRELMVVGCDPVEVLDALIANQGRVFDPTLLMPPLANQSPEA